MPRVLVPIDHSLAASALDRLEAPMKIFYSRHRNQAAVLQRRTFMKALGIGLSVPLAYKMSRLAIAQTGARPTRMFIMFVPHGVPMEHCEVGESMDFSRSGEGVLSPLEPFRNHVQVLRGLSNQVSTNHEAIRSVLTGRDGDNSIDFQVASALGTTAHVLGAHPYRANSAGPDHDAKLAHHGGWVTPITNPADALADLFAGVGAGAGGPSEVEQEVDEAEFRREALQLTERELASMQSELAGLTAEENKLQKHLESLQVLRAAQEGNGGIGVVGCSARPTLSAAESMMGKDPFDMNNFATILDGHLEAAAHAFVCGTARVVTLQCLHANAQVTMGFPGGPGIAKNHHDPLSHSWDAAGRADFAKVQKWFYSRLAEKFLKTLDQPDPADPEHSVLDNSVVLTCTEIADGANHNSEAMDVWIDGAPQASYLPWVLIGGGGGYLGGGRAVSLQGEDHRNVLAALAGAMGTPIATIGGANVTAPKGVLA